MLKLEQNYNEDLLNRQQPVSANQEDDDISVFLSAVKTNIILQL